MVEDELSLNATTSAPRWNTGPLKRPLSEILCNQTYLAVFKIKAIIIIIIIIILKWFREPEQDLRN